MDMALFWEEKQVADLERLAGKQGEKNNLPAEIDALGHEPKGKRNILKAQVEAALQDLQKKFDAIFE